MGRVTIFTEDDSATCLDVKEALKKRSVPFEEICISKYPERRRDLISLTDSVQTPQVFFNDEHIGGLRDVERLLSQWEIEAEFSAYETVLERCEIEVLDDADSPRDERLAIPAGAPFDSTRKDSVEDPPEISLPDGSSASVESVVSTLGAHLSRKNYRRLFRVQKNCFKGAAAVADLLALYGIKSREEIVLFGRKMQDLGIIQSVGKSQRFNNDMHLFRLHALVKPKILNSFFQRQEGVDSDPLRTVQELLGIVNKIILKATNPSTSVVDYARARNNGVSFRNFEFASTKLQVANGIAIMDESTKLAFFINLYNLMMKHALLKFGTRQFSRKFYRKMKYNVGGTTLSLLDLELGILRANTKLPNKSHGRFQSNDIRISLCVANMDNRFHFALYRGKKFSPIGIVYTKEALDEELDLTVRCFFTKKENFTLDETRRELRLPFFMREYFGDFGPKGVDKTPQSLVPYMRGKNKDKLSQMIRSGKPIRITFHPPSTAETNAAPLSTAMGAKKNFVSFIAPSPGAVGSIKGQIERRTSLMSSLDSTSNTAHQASADRWSLAGNSWNFQSSEKMELDLSQMDQSNSAVESKHIKNRKRASLGRRSTDGYGRTPSLSSSLKDWLDSSSVGEIQSLSPRTPTTIF